MSKRIFSAVILAAGYSSRMGCFKPLLPIDGIPIIHRVISIFQTNGITDIHVVVGHRRESISRTLDASNVHVVYNPNHQSGMFSSITAGIASIPPEISAFFVMPVDIPLVRPTTIEQLMTTYERHPETIIHPYFKGRRGHPPLIPARLIPEILLSDGNGGLKRLMEIHEPQSAHVEVPDRYIHFDIDEPGDYRSLLQLSPRRDIPSPDECEVILEKIHPVPDRVHRHCRAVERIAHTLGSALVRSDLNLDMDLIRAAALLHDIAKGERNHARVGCDLLKQMGFPRVGDIVAAHSDMTVPDDSEITEAEVVHLADKFVTGETVVSLSDRFDSALKRFGHDPEAAANIRQRRETAEKIQKRLETRIGFPLEAILDMKIGLPRHKPENARYNPDISHGKSDIAFLQTGDSYEESGISQYETTTESYEISSFKHAGDV